MEKQEILRRLITLRNERGFSQEKMAQIIGCKRTNYIKKEQGQIPIVTEEWLKIAAAFDLTIEVFFTPLPLENMDDIKFLVYGFHRLSYENKRNLLNILDAFLTAQWANSKFNRAAKNRFVSHKQKDLPYVKPTHLFRIVPPS